MEAGALEALRGMVEDTEVLQPIQVLLTGELRATQLRTMAVR